MSEEEMMVALFAIIGGLTFTGYVFTKIFGLVKAWIDRNNSGIHADDFNRLAKAFMKHKNDSERRIQNLEAIIADEEAEPTIRAPEDTDQLNTPSQSIEMEEPSRPQNETGEENNRGNDSNLRNMLRE